MAKRILHLSASAAWGGAEQMAEMICAECQRAGYDVRLELPFARGERWSTAAPFPVDWWRWALRSREPAEIVHAHLPWPDRLGAALVAARGRPLVVTFQLLPPAGKWPRDRCFHIPSERLLGIAGRLRERVRWVALSRADARTLGALLGVRVDVVRNAPPAPSSTPKPLVWPGGVTRMLSVGRLEHQKGFDAMIEALASPALRALPWRWNIIGSGAEQSALTSLISAGSLGEKISFVGARPAIDGMHDADLLLAPSRYEGMPLVPMEAAEAGVAVLASRIAPHEELYESLPDALLPADPRAWPEVIARFVTDPALRERVRLAQRALLGENPRLAMFEAYDRLYRSVTA